MPTLDLSELNVVIAVLGAFIVAYGFFSVKIKQVWYLGEACTSHRLFQARMSGGANILQCPQSFLVSY
jgi:hypothetical protein